MAAAIESMGLWDNDLHGAIPFTRYGADGALAETRIRTDCINAIERLVSIEERATWNRDGEFITATEPTDELIRRLMTNDHSVIRELPDAFALMTNEVAPRNMYP